MLIIGISILTLNGTTLQVGSIFGLILLMALILDNSTIFIRHFRLNSTKNLVSEIILTVLST